MIPRDLNGAKGNNRENAKRHFRQRTMIMTGFFFPCKKSQAKQPKYMNYLRKNPNCKINKNKSEQT